MVPIRYVGTTTIYDYNWNYLLKRYQFRYRKCLDDKPDDLKVCEYESNLQSCLAPKKSLEIGYLHGCTIYKYTYTDSSHIDV